jgi:hypothetical protein
MWGLRERFSEQSHTRSCEGWLAEQRLVVHERHFLRRRRRRPAGESGCRIINRMNEQLHPVQVEGFRQMTPAQKLQMVADLYHAGVRLKAAGLRMVHPDWSEERLDWEARRSLLYAGT